MTRGRRILHTWALPERSLGLLSAAFRHLRDAAALLGSSPDQAWHLAGYAPECARKATLAPDERFYKAVGHGVTPDAEAAWALAQAIDPWAPRYDTANWALRYPLLLDWNEASRYDRTPTHHREQAEPLVTEAAQAVEDVVLALWCDGRLPGSFVTSEIG